MIEGLLQPWHLLIILAVAVFVMGPKKLPELGKGLAEGIRSFQKGIDKGDIHKALLVSEDSDGFRLLQAAGEGPHSLKIASIFSFSVSAVKGLTT